jgi:hypothetical protein
MPCADCSGLRLPVRPIQQMAVIRGMECSEEQGHLIGDDLDADRTLLKSPWRGERRAVTKPPSCTGGFAQRPLGLVITPGNPPGSFALRPRPERMVVFGLSRIRRCDKLILIFGRANVTLVRLWNPFSPPYAYLSGDRHRGKRRLRDSRMCPSLSTAIVWPFTVSERGRSHLDAGRSNN